MPDSKTADPSSEEKPKTRIIGYQEDPNFVPALTDMRGSVLTNGNGHFSDIGRVTDVFRRAKKEAAELVLKALDPEDATPSRLVALPTKDAHNDPDRVRTELLTKANDMVYGDKIVDLSKPVEKSDTEDSDTKVSDTEVKTTGTDTDQTNPYDTLSD